MKIIHAVGQNCPIPVLMAKKARDEGEGHYLVEVDNEIACGNLKRFAESQGGTAEISSKGANFDVEIRFPQGTTADPAPAPIPVLPPSGYSLFCGNHALGQGSEELGTNLITMFFYTLAQSDNLPSHICLVNGGVKLAVENLQVAEHLQALVDKGVEVLVCGACLNYYALTPKAGQISNMYDILTALQNTPKVITLC